MNRGSVTFLVAVLATVLSASSRPQADNDSEYINHQFRAAINELPKLALVLPNGTVAADSQSPEIVVYSSAPTVDKTRLRVTLTPEKTLEFAKRNHVACDVPLYEKPPSFSLYDSAIKQFVGNPQVLHTTKLLPGVKAGYRLLPLEDALGNEVWKKMQPKSPEQLRKAAVIRRDGVPYFYSLATLYDGSQNEISRMGMLL
jgi:hypothetical protein